MVIRLGASKRFIYDIVYFTGEKDLKGAPVARTNFMSGVWKEAISLRENLLKEVEVGILDEKEVLVWKPLKEASKDDKIVAERFKDGDFEISDNEVELVRQYVKGASEKPLIQSECFKDLGDLI